MKQFLVILGLTALVWVGVSMADERDYPITVRLHFSGYDTTRYALLHADSTLGVRATLSGFDALLGSLLQSQPTVDLSLPEGSQAIAVADVSDRLRHSILGAKRVQCTTDSLRVQLAERHSRTYCPSIEWVQLGFSEQFGLYGEPTLTPAEITLYGPQQSLDSIGELHVAATTIGSISKTDSYRLAIEPVWERYADVHPSHREVTLHVPVEPYVERTYQVPISVSGADSTTTLKLYPEQATVRLWVAQRDLGIEPDLRVAIDYADVQNGHDEVETRLVQFPAHTRPRSIEPQHVHCLILH